MEWPRPCLKSWKKMIVIIFCRWFNDLKSILWLFFVHYKTDNSEKEKMFSTVCHPSNTYFNWNTPCKYDARNSIDGSLCDLIRRISELSLDGSKNRILQFGQRIKSGTSDDCNLDQEKTEKFKRTISPLQFWIQLTSFQNSKVQQQNCFY